ncbi:hypothetical protein J4E93_002054 [Alternaria ventricosa]|uniref:uncharacterized protein n=1 Tax=Alternaria ventricosa TaxID=1187951 RepID=UPI0020C2715B|nr:uncharacterized protein J4E93_002054 [Alternaria ventricosa]KAI4651858.1 hypothetical protein J4E93_002054 [Alternaria ventricosa]
MPSNAQVSDEASSIPKDAKTNFLHLSDAEFLVKLRSFAKFKERSHQTHHQVHVPELTTRLQLDTSLPTPSEDASPPAPDAPVPNLANTSPISVVYLGNSMLERFKTSGITTDMGKLGDTGVAWNAGVGGDSNQNVAYRLTEGLYDMLKTAKKDVCDIKLWILASGTNNLQKKRAFRKQDMESWRVLVEACLRIAPESTVLACDMSYRLDIPDEIVDQSNEMLREVVGEINEALRVENMEKEHELQTYEAQTERDREDKVKWVGTRHMFSKNMLDDHVHLNEEGYWLWDFALWPHVFKVLGVPTEKDDELLDGMKVSEIPGFSQ